MIEVFDGKVAVVTGAASGIGRALSERLAAEGMHVVMSDVDPQRLDEAVRAIESNHGEMIGIPTDVGSSDAVERLAARAVAWFGGVHLLCNNAGVSGGGAAWEVPLADWEWTLRVNFWGVVHGIRAFVPGMIERGEPAHVVNTASVAGLLGFPIVPPYIATKFAVVGLSEVLWHQLAASGAPVGVSVLCPGTVATNLSDTSNQFRPSGPAGRRAPAESMRTIGPAEVAEHVVRGVRENRFWILTHHEYGEWIERRARGIVNSQDPVRAPVI